jgi:hypothetical protein
VCRTPYGPLDVIVTSWDGDICFVSELHSVGNMHIKYLIHITFLSYLCKGMKPNDVLIFCFFTTMYHLLRNSASSVVKTGLSVNGNRPAWTPYRSEEMPFGEFEC